MTSSPWIQAAGFDHFEDVNLPSDDWTNYYGALQEYVMTYRSSHYGNPSAQSLAFNTQNEINYWKECGDRFGYCFLVGRAVRR